MKHISTANITSFFKPLIDSGAVQAAMMVLPPGESSSNAVADEHPESEQWLFVMSGSGQAKVKNRTIKLKTGSLLLIERHEPHQVVNTGQAPLVTLNMYAPPAYTSSGNLKRRNKG